MDSFITQAEVTEVVGKVLSGKAPGLDEIPPEYLKSLDVVGLSWSQDLQHVLGWFAAKCEAAGKKISTSKSETMALDRKKVACSLRVGGEFLPQVEDLKYFGVLFTSEGKMEREIDRRIGAAAAVMRLLYRSVMVKRVEPKGKALDLLANLCSYPHLWS